MTLLALKLSLTPLLIAAITLAGQRFGPRVAGALTALPVAAGPVAFFLAVEQGAPFAAQAARATLAGELSLGAFSVLYAWACLRARWWTSLALGWGGFAASTLALDRFDPTLGGAAALALATPLAIRALTPRPQPPARVGAMPRAEIAVRMAAGAALVATLSSAAPGLGPRLAGLLTIFPIAITVLTVFSHRGQGAAFTVHMLRGLAVGLYSLTAFFATIALALQPLGVAPTFALAVAASLAGQVVVLRGLRRSRA